MEPQESYETPIEPNELMRTINYGVGWLKCGHVFVDEKNCQEALLQNGYGAV